MKVVILHDLRVNSRHTQVQYLQSFAEFNPGLDVVYANVFGSVDESLNEADLVVLFYDFLSLRNAPFWRILVNRVSPVITSAKRKIMIPQDDYTSCIELDTLAQEFQVDAIYSGILTDLEILYPKSTASGIRFEHAYAGYAPDVDDPLFVANSQPYDLRVIDLGQRIRHLPPQFGEMGSRKALITVKLANHLKSQGFRVDVSTNDSGALAGSNWLKFLGGTRFTTGRKGGASLADPRSRNADRVRRFCLRHPDSTMDDVSRSVRLRGTRQGDFSAISPRMFESSALETCQILEEDHYFYNFEPWVHYVPLKKDFSNLSEISQVMRDNEQAKEIVRNCYKRLIGSGEFSYRRFIEGLFARELPKPDAFSTRSVVDHDCALGTRNHPMGNVRRLSQQVLRRAVVSKCSHLSPIPLSHTEKVHLEGLSDEHRDAFLSIVVEWQQRWNDKRLIPESLLFDWSGVL